MIKIFEKNYDGFESLYDLERDMSEILDKDLNPLVKDFNPEFSGTIKVTIEAEESCFNKSEKEL